MITSSILFCTCAIIQRKNKNKKRAPFFFTTTTPRVRVRDFFDPPISCTLTMSNITNILGGWIYDFPRTLIDLIQEGLPYCKLNDRIDHWFRSIPKMNCYCCADLINPLLDNLVSPSMSSGEVSIMISPSFIITEVSKLQLFLTSFMT